MHRKKLLFFPFIFTCLTFASNVHAQRYGIAQNGLPNCSATYNGDRELGDDDRTYGWQDTNRNGELDTCVVTHGRISPVQQCINLGGDLESERDVDFGYDITGDDLDEVVAQGFDTVRIPVRWSAFTGNAPRYRIERSFWNEVDRAVNAALERDLNVILDVHHFDEFNTDPDGNEAKLFAIWRQLSSHYRNFSNKLIFELLNEPHFENVRGENQDFGGVPTGIIRINRLNRRLVRLIRRRNPERWIIVGSSQFGSIDPLVNGASGVFFRPPANDRRIITTAHYYDPLEFTHQRLEFGNEHPDAFGAWGNRRDRATVARDFNQVAQWQASRGRNYPFLLGEFGTSRATSSQPGTPPALRNLYAQVIRQNSEANNFGWCYWDLGSGSFGIFDPDENVFVDGIVDVLVP